jgi:hypothetical protein
LFLLFELGSQVLDEFPLNLYLLENVVTWGELHPAFATFALFGFGRLLLFRGSRGRLLLSSHDDSSWLFGIGRGF